MDPLPQSAGADTAFDTMVRQSPFERALAAALIVSTLVGVAACGIKGPLRPAPKEAVTPAPALPPIDNPATLPATTSPALPPPSSTPAERQP